MKRDATTTSEQKLLHNGLRYQRNRTKWFSRTNLARVIYKLIQLFRSEPDIFIVQSLTWIFYSPLYLIINILESSSVGVYLAQTHETRMGMATAMMAMDPTFLSDPLQRSFEQKHSLVAPRSRQPSRFVPCVSGKQSRVTAEMNDTLVQDC